MAEDTEQEVPDVLWKYRAWNDNVRRMIVKSEIYYAKRSQLNDPLDCSWIEQFPQGQHEQREFVKTFCNKWASRPLSDQERLEDLIKIQNAVRALAWSSGDSRKPLFLDTGPMDVGVMCLSEINDNYLMWSHYADNHKGVCIGIRTHFHGKILRPCIYSDDPQVIDVWEYVRPLRGALVDALRTKGTAWSYEREWRTIDRSGPAYLTHCVDSIAFGVNTDAATRSEVLATVAEAGYPIKILQASLHKSKNEIVVSSDQ